LYATFGGVGCDKVEEPEEVVPEEELPEPIPGCKRVGSLDDRFVKRIE